MTDQRRLIWSGAVMVVSCLGTPSALAQAAAQAAAEASIQDRRASVAKLMDRQFQRLASDPDGVAFSVCMASRDRVMLLDAQGQRKHGDAATIDTDTRFRIASLSKSFAATVTAQLVDEGSLSWSDRVSASVDYFTLKDPGDARRAQLDHLLSHRLGLPPNAYDKLLEAGQRPESIVQRFSRVDPICSVGSCYGYQNIGYNVISDVIHTRTGQSIEEQVQRRLFEPLGMRQSSFGEHGLKATENWAQPHIGRGTRLRPAGLKPHYYRVPASAGINASIADMCSWLQAQLGARSDVLSDSLRGQLWTPQVETRAELYRGRWRRVRLDAAHYGLGWRLYDYQGEPVVFHAGSVQGYGAQIVILPERDVGLVGLWNSQSTRPWGITPTFLDAMLGLRAEDWMKLNTIGKASESMAAGSR